MSIKNDRITDFLSWAADYVKEFQKPMTKGTLSKIFVREKQKTYHQYYFSMHASDQLLAKKIKESSHSLEVQAKLMCLFSFPVDTDFFKILQQFANIELDNFRRISIYEYGNTYFTATHRKPRAEILRNITRSGREAEEGDEMDVAEDDDDLEILDVTTLSTAQTSPQKSINPHDVQSSSSMPITSAPLQLPTFLIPNRLDFRLPGLLDSKDQARPRPADTPSTFNGESFSKDNTPRPLELGLVNVLQKLEYFFLYKCRPELMPLCLRIKEIKENQARYTEEIISDSTIKSFFEVPLRLMVAKKVENPIKNEYVAQERPPLLMDFLTELKNNNIVGGLGEVVDDIIIKVGQSEKISYHTIAKTFMEIVDNLSMIC